MIAYGDSLTAFTARVLRDHELAKDVRQQVFLEALQGLEKFEGRSSLWSWLCSIAVNRCIDARRKNQRAGVMDDFEVWEGLLGQPDPMMDDGRLAKRRALEQCLGKLSDSFRSQLLMRCFLGLSYNEIATAIGATPGAVQVRLSRILPRLRKCLRSNGVAR